MRKSLVALDVTGYFSRPRSHRRSSWWAPYWWLTLFPQFQSWLGCRLVSRKFSEPNLPMSCTPLQSVFVLSQSSAEFSRRSCTPAVGCGWVWRAPGPRRGWWRWDSGAPYTDGWCECGARGSWRGCSCLGSLTSPASLTTLSLSLSRFEQQQPQEWLSS